MTLFQDHRGLLHHENQEHHVPVSRWCGGTMPSSVMTVGVFPPVSHEQSPQWAPKSVAMRPGWYRFSHFPSLLYHISVQNFKQGAHSRDCTAGDNSPAYTGSNVSPDPTTSSKSLQPSTLPASEHTTLSPRLAEILVS